MKKIKSLLKINAEPSGAPHSFAFYCDGWLAQCRDRIRESSYIKYETAVKRHIKPELGAFPPERITTEAVGEFSRGLLCAKQLAPKTVRDILVVLHSILEYSSRRFPNVFSTVEISYPKEGRKTMRVLSRDEQRRFIDYLSRGAGDPCKLGLLLMLLTGMRIGELCALRWGSIDCAEQTLSITATMQRLRCEDDGAQCRTRIAIGAPKSDTSMRVIPLTDGTAALCRRYCVADADAFVLTGTEKFMEPRTLQYRIAGYTAECGLEGVHAHTLRHTFATRAVEVGFEIKSLSEILGHASTTITLERYVHPSIELKRQNMQKLESAGL